MVAQRMVSRILWGTIPTLVLVMAGCQSETTDTATSSGGAGAGDGTGGSGGGAIIDDNPEDCLYDSVDAHISLSAGASAVDGSGAVVDGDVVTVTSGGVYQLSGTLTDGQIVVDSTDDGTVKIVLDGAFVTSSTGAALRVASAAKVAVIAASDSSLGDLGPHTDGLDENGALYSSSDLTVCGPGTLTVSGNHNDGIAAKDGLILRDASLRVTAVDDGIRGKDYLLVDGDSGDIVVQAAGDGLKADNEAGDGWGYIQVKAGNLNITSGGDAVTAQTDVLIEGGAFTITSGGGSGAYIGADTSAKGIKGLSHVDISGGTININSADDGIHSNDAVLISDGTMVISSGDDGIHGDISLAIEGGVMDIITSYEGLESIAVSLGGGDVNLYSTDDGLNASDGSGGMGVCNSCVLTINGGYLVVDADGDGIDSNGHMQINGGTVIVNGPTQSQNSGIDCNGDMSVNGGFLVSVHTLSMSDEIEGSSTQNLVRIGLSNTQQAGTLVHIQNSSSADLLTFAPSKIYRGIVFSSPSFVNGSYSLYTGGSSTGTATDGLYSGGQYTPGNLVANFNVSSVITNVGNSGGFP